jgi:hypothetical protein
MVIAILSKFGSFFTKQNIVLLYDTAIKFLGIYSIELKTCSHKNLPMTVYNSVIIDKMKHFFTLTRI